MSLWGALVVKLPASEVDEAISAGRGERLSMGRGRVMKEWLVVHWDGRRWGLARLTPRRARSTNVMMADFNDFEVEVFFDGDCPLCTREIALLRKLDEPARNIRFTDIQAPEFSPEALGLTSAHLMHRIHGRLPDGRIIEGTEVFRRLYAAVGFRRAVEFSRLPGVSQLLDAAYALFARNRLRLSGRCTDLCALPSRESSAAR